MPTARRTATPRNSASTATRPPQPYSPVLNAGSTTWSVDQPSTQASATVSAPNSSDPSVDRVNTHGSRRIATPSTPKPSRSVLPEVTDDRSSWPVSAGWLMDTALLT